jgi:hypothetical protein
MTVTKFPLLENKAWVGKGRWMGTNRAASGKASDLEC